MTFDYSLDFASIDYRKNPKLYRIGKGEQGVHLVVPYKSAILPHWRFKTPDIARKSANKIYKMFLDYKKREDFVGMDMARKFLQWVTRGHEDMPITNQDVNTSKAARNYCRAKKILGKLNLRRYFTRRGRRLEKTKNMWS